MESDSVALPTEPKLISLQTEYFHTIYQVRRIVGWLQHRDPTYMDQRLVAIIDDRSFAVAMGCSSSWEWVGELIPNNDGYRCRSVQ